MARPTMTVLLPVWNEELYVLDALGSLLGQTCGDFELLVLSDGATTAVLDRVRSVSDPRIKLLEFPHRGLTRTLIAGTRYARGEFLVRMDADDLCDPRRLTMQLDRMREDSACAVLGTAFLGVSADGTPLYVARQASEHDEILRAMLAGHNPFCHGSMVIRRQMYERVGGYCSRFPFAQDFDLSLRLSTVGRLANLDQILYVRRERPSSISATREVEQDQCTAQALERYRSGLTGTLDGELAPPLADANRPVGNWDARRAYANFYQRCAYCMIFNANSRGAISQLAIALWQRRLVMRTLRLLAAAVVALFAPRLVCRVFSRRGASRDCEIPVYLARGKPSEKRLGAKEGRAFGLSIRPFRGLIGMGGGS